MSLFKLFLIFLKIGAILLGGGYVILPIMISEFSEKRELVTNDDIVNYFAISQSLPGIIAANMSMFIGYKLKGKFGAIIAMLGVTFVPFWSIVLLASIIGALLDNSIVQGALWGVGVAVVALIILTTREMWRKSKRDVYFYSMFTLSLTGLLVFHLSPIQAILIFSILGLSFKKLKECKK